MLIEQILERKNLQIAFKRVKKNKGSAGVDNISQDEFPKYLQENWVTIKQEILEEKYKPNPVRKVEIPKPNGGIRQLGIPTLTDRLVQQAILQILSPIYEKKFSNSSFGFRPGKSAHQALKQSQGYINEGYKYTVDMDMAKFFDTVNHDRLMKRMTEDIKDKTLLRLIRKYLNAGIMDKGVKIKSEVGTPQGGPLSPLLANIVLDELDKELESRGHKFCRYADDCNIYVKSKRAGERVMQSTTKFIEEKLKLKVNQSKSAVDMPSKRKFLGFSIYWNRKGEARITVSRKSKQRLQEKIKELTRRNRSMNLKTRIDRIDQYLTGWLNYYQIADMKTFLIKEEGRLKRRLRMCIWKQWKKVRTRYRRLKQLGLSHTEAIKYANTRKGYWRVSNSPILTRTLTNDYFDKLGLTNLTKDYLKLKSI